MTLVADGDVQDQIIQALQAVKYDIVTYDQLGLPIRPDKLLMEKILSLGGVLEQRSGDRLEYSPRAVKVVEEQDLLPDHRCL